MGLRNIIDIIIIPSVRELANLEVLLYNITISKFIIFLIVLLVEVWKVYQMKLVAWSIYEDKSFAVHPFRSSLPKSIGKLVILTNYTGIISPMPFSVFSWNVVRGTSFVISGNIWSCQFSLQPRLLATWQIRKLLLVQHLCILFLFDMQNENMKMAVIVCKDYSTCTTILWLLRSLIGKPKQRWLEVS